MEITYYCLYRFFSCIQSKRSAHQWTALIPTLIAITHAITIYYLAVHFSGSKMIAASVATPWIIGVMAIGMLFSYLFFIKRGNGLRIVEKLESTRTRNWYPVAGGAIVVETFLLPYVTIFILIKMAR